MNNKEFYEKQRLNQWWLWLLIAAVNIPFVYGFYRQVISGNTFGNHPMSDTALTLTTIMVLLLSIAVLFSRLTTVINQEGVYVRYFPFNLKYKFFAWDEITDVYVREYKALGEYGGFGIRYNTKGKAYIASGKYGIQLKLRNRKSVLISTQHPGEVEELLEKVSP